MELFDGRYEILGTLGEGGMGVVHDALDRVTGRRVALKRLPVDHADPLALAFFDREVRVLRQLKIAGVPRLFERSAARGENYFTMERVDGVDFDSWRTAFDVGRFAAARLLARAGLLLEAIHRAGVVHGDVKPGNLLVDAGGAPHWIDFGISSSRDAAPIPEEEDVLIGTLAYLPPERLGVSPVLHDARSDVYALGVMLYEILTGRLPFDGDDETEVMGRIEYSSPVRPDDATEGEVPSALAEVVLHAIEKRPDARYQTAGQLARAVLDALDGRGATPELTAA